MAGPRFIEQLPGGSQEHVSGVWLFDERDWADVLHLQ
jgi:hypothetical protein